MSLNHAAQSTTTSSLLLAKDLDDVLDAGRSDQLGHLR